jgi:hypothetical protein
MTKTARRAVTADVLAMSKTESLAAGVKASDGEVNRAHTPMDSGEKNG